MALTSYTTAAGLVSVNAAHGQDGLVVRYIEPILDASNVVNRYALHLGGYTSGLTLANQQLLMSAQPTVSTNYVFEQMGMNGYSPNSEFNINTIGHAQGIGRIGAVGYTLEFVEEIQKKYEQA